MSTKKTLELTKLTKQQVIKFKSTEFQQRKIINSIIFSRPFFPSPNGYKLCISVGTHGSGEDKGNYVSVFGYLMKGENDDSLFWPFTGTVIIELLNQLEDKNHHIKILKFLADSKSSQKVDRGGRGRGHDKFIAYADLDYNADKNTQYLKDDTLHCKK